MRSLRSVIVICMNNTDPEMKREQALAQAGRFSWLFTLVGVLLLIVSGYLIVEKRSFLADAVETRAKVLRVDVQRLTGSGRTGSTVTYQPTFEFEDEAGVSHVATTLGSSSAWRFAKGELVTIRYDPDNPSDVRPKTGFFSEWMVQLITGGIGLGFVIISIGFRHAVKAHPDTVQIEGFGASHRPGTN